MEIEIIGIVLILFGVGIFFAVDYFSQYLKRRIFIERHSNTEKNVFFIAIGNLENRRIKFFYDAVSSFLLPPPFLISYNRLLSTPNFDWKNVIKEATKSKVSLFDSIVLNICKKFMFPTRNRDNIKHVVIRFDSVGENFDVEKGFIMEGDNATLSPHLEILEKEILQKENKSKTNFPHISKEEAEKMTFEKGKINFQRQWFLGFQKKLHQWDLEIQKAAKELEKEGISVSLMNSPKEVAIMFDKRLTHFFLSKNKISVPKAFYNVQNYEDLVKKMSSEDVKRSFVKISNGSSASGVVAFSRKNSEMALTSAEIAKEKDGKALFNSLKIRKYTNPDEIQFLMDKILSETAIVEEWLPKEIFENMQFDIRYIVINGKATHFVLRGGKNGSPITNLHLGNARLDAKKFLENVSIEKWQKVVEICEKVAMHCFPESLYLALDVLVTPGLENVYILEVNAFGDLLPRILHEGYDTYSYEVIECFKRIVVGLKKFKTQ